MNILALDLSLYETGYCFNKDEKINYGVIKPPKDFTQLSKMIDIGIQIQSIIVSNDIKAVFLEGYSYASRNTKWTFSAGELGGITKHMLYANDLDFAIVAPTMWKKYICGKGNMKKEQILLQVFKKYKLEFHNNNECDAFCIYNFAKDFLSFKSGETSFSKSDIECFKKFDKEEKDNE